MPPGLQVAAAWAWRVLLVVAVIFGLGWLLRYLSEVMVPLAIAILLAALLSPVANRLRSWGLPRGAATAGTVLGGLALIAGSLVLIGTQIAVPGLDSSPETSWRASTSCSTICGTARSRSATPG